MRDTPLIEVPGADPDRITVLDLADLRRAVEGNDFLRRIVTDNEYPARDAATDDEDQC